jgi:hypothetical protein
MLDSIFLLILIAADALIASLVLFSKPKNKTNQSFALVMLFLMLWIASNYYENEAAMQSYAPLLLRLDFAFAIIMSAFFFIFCLNFPKSGEMAFKKKAAMFLPALILAVFSFGDLVITNIRFNEETIISNNGPLGFVYLFFIAFYIFGGCLKLAISRRKATGTEKVQISYILTGFFISASIALVFNQILPLFMFVPMGIARIGLYGTLIFCISSSVAILEYHLFDIRLILTETLVGGMGTALFVLPFLIADPNLKILASVIFFLYCFVGYLLIKSTKKEISEKIDLSQMVQERTKDLQQSKEELEHSKKVAEDRAAELEKWYNLTIGRELRMAELKEKIKEMEEKPK